MPFVPRLFFSPPISVEKLGKVFMDVPKFVLRHGSKSPNSTHPYSSFRHKEEFRVSFPPSSGDAYEGRSFVLQLASHPGPKFESAD
ncbi:hypothetical protein AVEN_260143-1 [Araneus ventricosus]|uniref:Uncharacterized protein n=1 Tax=Araneus ventricosus TaxID=182803 RepID=A0A4Y2DGE8_ARAVE|nr:hypothetical protein AVEN_260143-1 [Araneus ventricosus]